MFAFHFWSFEIFAWGLVAGALIMSALAIGVMNSHKDHPKLSLDQRTALIDYFNEKFTSQEIR